MASKVEGILEEIKGLTLLEASELVKQMEAAFGVSAAVAAPAAAGPAAAGAAPVEEKTEFTVVLTDVGAVSYTHLDVYKRQHQERMETKKFCNTCRKQTPHKEVK